MPKIAEIGRKTVRVSGVNALGIQVRKVYSERRHGPRYLDQAKKFFESMLFDSGMDEHIGTWARLTVRELAERYRDEHLIKTRAAGNASYVELIINRWGDYRISTITIGAVRPWIWDLLHGEYSAFSVHKICRYMIRIFNWGVETETIRRNPVEHLIDVALKKEFKRLMAPRRIIITRDEFDRLAAAMPQYMADIVTMAWATGMRCGEVISVRWSNIVDGRIRFSAAEDKEVKEKTVVLDNEAAALIDRIRADRLISGIESELIFIGPNGNALKNFNISCAFRHYSNKAGFQNLRMHDLRHCYQVRMRRAGFDPKAIAAQLGHSTPDMDAWYDLVSQDEQDALTGKGTAESSRNQAFSQDEFAEAVARKLSEIMVPKAGVEPARRLRSKGF